MLILKILNSICLGWEKEYKFHPSRLWRFDYANPKYKIAIEIEGGLFIQGRHIRGKGYINDMIKYNEAQKLGWKLLRYSTAKNSIDNMVRDVEYILKKQEEENEK